MNLMKTLLAASVAVGLTLNLGATSAQASGGGAELISQKWSFQGVRGTFDRGALRRGFQIYAEVCASCHSLEMLAYRNLMDIDFTEDEVKAYAQEFEVEDGPNDEGDMFMRPARLSDKFVSPYANEQAARYSNDGAFPPDLSVITKARVGGPDYLYALLTRYVEEVPEGAEVPDGKYYNEVFPGHAISMPPPLYGEDVEYADGTTSSIDQEARDVVTFLSWAAEPELEERKSLGISVMIYLFILTFMLYLLKVRIWKRVCMDGSDQKNPPA